MFGGINAGYQRPKIQATENQWNIMTYNMKVYKSDQ